MKRTTSILMNVPTIMIEKLLEQHESIELVCNLYITQRYDKYGAQVSSLSDVKTSTVASSSPNEDTVTTGKRNNEEKKPNITDDKTYIWEINARETDGIKGY